MNTSSQTHRQNQLNTRAIADSIKLANSAIQTSSFFAIRGRRGTGRSFIYDAILADWQAKKVECEPLYFLCVPDSDPDRVLRQMARAITGKVYAPWERPTLMDLFALVAETCRKHEANFLFVDDFHYLSKACCEMLVCLFDAVRDQDILIGMAMTTSTQTLELLDAQTHPAFLDTVWTSALAENETIAAMAVLEPRLQSLADAYFDGKPGGKEACQALFTATKGNFKTMEAVIETIAKARPHRSIALKDLEHCLALRRASANTEQNFALAA
jgi:Cdc6-like AAA superfamily ATPase